MSFIEDALIIGAAGVIIAMLSFLWGVWRGVNEADDISNWGAGRSAGYDCGYDNGYQDARSREDHAQCKKS